MQARKLIAAVAGAAALVLPASAFGGHGLEATLLDHPARGFAPAPPR
jgi:hypothetical protein